MNRVRPFLFLIMLLISAGGASVFASPCHAEMNPDMPLREFMDILELGNASEIAESLEALRGRPPKIEGDDLRQFIPTLWDRNKNESRYPKLNWDALQKDVARIRLASVLLQDWGNRAIELDHPESVILYVRKSLSASIQDVKWIALFSLYNVESDAIVRDVAIIAAKENSLFKLAIRVLAEKCSKNARDYIVTLAKKMRREENKKYLESVLEENVALRTRLGTPLCPRVCETCDLPAK